MVFNYVTTFSNTLHHGIKGSHNRFLQLSAITMAEHPQVRICRFFLICRHNSSEHVLFRGSAQHPVINKLYPAQKIHTGGDGLDEYFIGMQGKTEVLLQKIAYRQDKTLQFFPVMG